MDLQQKILSDYQEAQRARDEIRSSILRLVRSNVKYAEIEKGKSLDDAGVLEVIGRQIRQQRESITEFQKGGRQDLVAREEAQLQVLLTYLPQQLSREEMTAMAQQAIAQVQARGLADKGKVMSRLMPQVRGKADGREISDIVSELLAKL